MQNVGTAYAVKRAVIDGEPLTERVVTLTGESVSRPGNVWARLGTPGASSAGTGWLLPGSEQMVIMEAAADGLYPAVAGCASGEDYQLPARPFPNGDGRNAERERLYTL